MFVCWSVGLSAFYRPHDICPLCGAASEWPRAGSAVVASGPARRAGKRMHSESTRARMPYNFSKNRCADAFQKQLAVRARAHAVVYVTAEIFKKKGKQKTNMPLPKFSLQFAFSWSVYFSNRTESSLTVGRSRPWSARLYL